MVGQRIADSFLVEQRSIEQGRESREVAVFATARKQLATFLYKTYIEEALAINVIGSTSGFKGLFVVNDDMRNVPDPRTVVQGGFYNLPPRMELYYYENPSQHLHYTPR